MVLDKIVQSDRRDSGLERVKVFSTSDRLVFLSRSPLLFSTYIAAIYIAFPFSETA